MEESLVKYFNYVLYGRECVHYETIEAEDEESAEKALEEAYGNLEEYDITQVPDEAVQAVNEAKAAIVHKKYKKKPKRKVWDKDPRKKEDD